MIDIKEQALQMQRPKKQHCILLGGLNILSEEQRTRRCSYCRVSAYGGLTQFGVEDEATERAMTVQGHQGGDKSMCGFSLSGHMRGAF